MQLLRQRAAAAQALRQRRTTSFLCFGRTRPRRRNFAVAREVLFARSVFRLPPFFQLIAATCCSSLLACNEDRPYEFQPRPSAPNFQVRIAPAENLISIETDALTHAGKPTRVRCETCHAEVDTGKPARAADELTAFHQGLKFAHGTLACSACHEPGEPLRLRLATGETIAMTEAMSLCSQCHGPTRRSYDNGSHGGMNGHWDLSRGPRLRNQCVHCHDPHSPQITPVAPVHPPRDRGHPPQRSANKGVH